MRNGIDKPESAPSCQAWSTGTTTTGVAPKGGAISAGGGLGRRRLGRTWRSRRAGLVVIASRRAGVREGEDEGEGEEKRKEKKGGRGVGEKEITERVGEGGARIDNSATGVGLRVMIVSPSDGRVWFGSSSKGESGSRWPWGLHPPVLHSRAGQQPRHRGC
ncbi:hypothetical protein VTN96DRAFT_6372 [Rasamsonia emersonii]